MDFSSCFLQGTPVVQHSGRRLSNSVQTVTRTGPWRLRVKCLAVARGKHFSLSIRPSGGIVYHKDVGVWDRLKPRDWHLVEPRDFWFQHLDGPPRLFIMARECDEEGDSGVQRPFEAVEVQSEWVDGFQLSFSTGGKGPEFDAFVVRFDWIADPDPPDFKPDPKLRRRVLERLRKHPPMYEKVPMVLGEPNGGVVES